MKPNLTSVEHLSTVPKRPCCHKTSASILLDLIQLELTAEDSLVVLDPLIDITSQARPQLTDLPNVSPLIAMPGIGRTLEIVNCE